MLDKVNAAVKKYGMAKVTLVCGMSLLGYAEDSDETTSLVSVHARLLADVIIGKSGYHSTESDSNIVAWANTFAFGHHGEEGSDPWAYSSDDSKEERIAQALNRFQYKRVPHLLHDRDLCGADLTYEILARQRRERGE